MTRRGLAAGLLLILWPITIGAASPAREDETAGVPRHREGHKEELDDAPAAVSRADQATTSGAPVVRGNFRSLQVNVDASGDNILGDAANEPSMGIDPTNPDNIVIGWRQFDTITSNFRQAGVAYSHDGGATWAFPGVLEPGRFRSDPVVTADSNGTFFYYSLSTTTTAEMFISSDAGETWTGPIGAQGGGHATAR